MHIIIGAILMLFFIANLIWLIYSIIKEYKINSASLIRTVLTLTFDIVFNIMSLYVTFVIACLLFGIILLFYY